MNNLPIYYCWSIIYIEVGIKHRQSTIFRIMKTSWRTWIECGSRQGGTPPSSSHELNNETLNSSLARSLCEFFRQPREAFLTKSSNRCCSRFFICAGSSRACQCSSQRRADWRTGRTSSSRAMSNTQHRASRCVFGALLSLFSSPPPSFYSALPLIYARDRIHTLPLSCVPFYFSVYGFSSNQFELVARNIAFCSSWRLRFEAGELCQESLVISLELVLFWSWSMWRCLIQPGSSGCSLKL
jgi:hypothetical protein